MTPSVGQKERETQNRVIELFKTQLGYDYLGNWEKREDNSNFEEECLRAFLSGRSYSEKLIDRAIQEFRRVSEQNKSLYELNKEVYGLLRYGMKVREEVDEQYKTVWLIDWKRPEMNHFAIAEEVTVRGNKTKRPDIVLYINGIAVGVLELKRSTVSVVEGVRQSIGNQEDEYIKPFFATVQIVMAGNDTEGLRYATIESPEEYFHQWKEEGLVELSSLDRQITQLCDKKRILDLIHDFIVFDSGIKKICRHNQYFGVKAAQLSAKKHKGGIIWHTQGSGKSLTMVWLAKWILENISKARVLVLTDRVELDEQIKGIFFGVDEDIYRTKNCRDLIEQLNTGNKRLLCSLIHKFRYREVRDETHIDEYLSEIKAALPKNFEAKGDIFVFVDECHRSHGGKLHKAMKNILPQSTIIGFTGTPLLKDDKRNSRLLFGDYIHTYKYDEAVADNMVLDLRYEARRVEQNIVSQDKIDEWFEERTKGLTEVAKNKLKELWGTMQRLLSSESRLEKIVFDILDDFFRKPRLASGRGNAMLVASSIYEACQYYKIFQDQGFNKCAVITSYGLDATNTTDREYVIYQNMLAGRTKEDFERDVKKQFIEKPGQMQLLIVVDKLLTGFDAPPATYLYIDKNMQDHGLFQAICRVNRLDGEDKEYGYIIDYRDLFKKLELAVVNYTSGAFEGFDREDVLNLLKDKYEKGKEGLEKALEVVHAICEPVSYPKRLEEYIYYFCGDVEDKEALKNNELKRVELYKAVSRLLRAYVDIASDMQEAGFRQEHAKKIEKDVKHYVNVKTEIMLASGDYIDLKKYEPAMRMLFNRYIVAEESEQISTFDDMTLVDLIISKGKEGIDKLPETIKQSREATAETIKNNIRRLIIDEMPTNPRYYQNMSEILVDLVKRRKQEDIEYEKYLKELIELAKKVRYPEQSTDYPSSIDTNGKRALYDNLGKDKAKALKVHTAILESREAYWRGNKLKERKIKNALKDIVPNEEVDDLFEIIRNQSQDEY
ncbi:type I restriction endonuclease subunit R [bacterium]|nr:type I restriction endonuclease subunit R [bacterium]